MPSKLYHSKTCNLKTCILCFVLSRRTLLNVYIVYLQDKLLWRFFCLSERHEHCIAPRCCLQSSKANTPWSWALVKTIERDENNHWESKHIAKNTSSLKSIQVGRCFEIKTLRTYVMVKWKVWLSSQSLGPLMKVFGVRFPALVMCISFFLASRYWTVYHGLFDAIEWMNELNGVLGRDSVLVRLYWAGTTWAYEMNFAMNHAPGARSLARPVAQQSSATTVPRMPHLTLSFLSLPPSFPASPVSFRSIFHFSLSLSHPLSRSLS